MTHDQVADDVFLAEMGRFLSACGVPEGSDAPPIEIPLKDEDDLLLSSHDLVAESEALLSSCDSTKRSPVTVDTSDSGGNERQFGNSDEMDARRQQRNANAAKRRLKYSTKIKNERQSLKQQEKELLDILAKLQEERNRERWTKGKIPPKSAWRAIAARQLQGRLAAERQRLQLRNAVKRRAASVEALREMVYQQLCKTDNFLCDVNTELSLSVLDATDVAMFERFSIEVDVAYKQTDATFHSWGPEGLSDDFYSKHRPKRTGDSLCVECLEVQSIPFEFKPTSDAMWQAVRVYHRQKNRLHFKDSLDPSNTVAVKFYAIGQRESGESSSLLTRMVYRRYVEQGRVIFVWRADTRGEGAFSHFQADETGWSVFSPNDTEKRGLMPTIARTLVHFSPFSLSSEPTGTQAVMEFSKLAAIAGEEDGTEITRMMEALLLEDM